MNYFKKSNSVLNIIKHSLHQFQLITLEHDKNMIKIIIIQLFF